MYLRGVGKVVGLNVRWQRRIEKKHGKEEMCIRDRLSGVFHSFTGTLEEAEKVLEYSRFVFGINGVVTLSLIHI